MSPAFSRCSCSPELSQISASEHQYHHSLHSGELEPSASSPQCLPPLPFCWPPQLWTCLLLLGSCFSISSSFQTHTSTHVHTHVHIHMYVLIYSHMYMHKHAHTLPSHHPSSLSLNVRKNRKAFMIFFVQILAESPCYKLSRRCVVSFASLTTVELNALWANSI